MLVTVGVEEEFHIVDRSTRRLVDRAPELLRVLPDRGFTAELHRSTVETNSRPHRSMADLRTELVDLRGKLVDAAAPLGLGPIAAGSAPLAAPTTGALTPNPRYQGIVEQYRQLTREQIVCATQVHVHVPDRDLAVTAMPWMSPWLPLLLAVSASSPVWMGVDTGFASWRSMLARRWPTSGPVGEFGSAAEYDATADALVRTGVIRDAGMLYTDIRPSHHVPTLELRVCDSCSDVDIVVLIAALFRALVLHASECAQSGQERPVMRRELIDGATWQASRWGLEGLLVHPERLVAVPAAEALHAMADMLRPKLEACGDWEMVSGVLARVLASGTSAARQRQAASGRSWDPAAAVDLLLEETQAWGLAEALDTPRTA